MPRLTVVESVYHQSPPESPTQVESRYTRQITSEEQVYTRRTQVGESWQPLDLGWIQEVGLLVIQNEEGRHLSVVPTPEERQEIDGRILELKLVPAVDPSATISHVAYWVIPPQESMRGIPCEGDLFVRCRKGKARFTVTVYPA